MNVCSHATVASNIEAVTLGTTACFPDSARCAVEPSERLRCDGGDSGDNVYEDRYTCSYTNECCYDDSSDEGECYYPVGHECYTIGCENGGYCIDDEYEGVYCDCSNGFRGRRCEIGENLSRCRCFNYCNQCHKLLTANQGRKLTPKRICSRQTTMQCSLF